MALVLLCLPLLPTGATLLLLFAGVLVLTWFGFRQAHTSWALPKAVFPERVLLLFGLWLLVPFIASVSPKDSAVSAAIWVACACVYLAGRQAAMASEDQLREALWAVPLAAIPVSLLAIYQFVAKVATPTSWIDAQMAELIPTRAYATFDNPTMLADYLALTIPLTLALLWGSGGVRKLWGGASLALQLAALTFTFSRGGWLATALELTAMVVLLLPRSLGPLLALGAAGFLLAPRSVTVRALSIFTGGDSSTRYRLTIWKAGWRLIRDFWPTGVGLGAPAFARAYIGYEIAGTPAMHTHNLFMQLLAETGLAGLALFCWYCGSLLSRVLRHKGPVSLALALGLGGQLVHGLFDHIWYTPRNMLFFWCVAGLLTGRCVRQEGERL
ncbi:MAG: O-antigen ligase family protein [Bacillota bacterium]